MKTSKISKKFYKNQKNQFKTAKPNTLKKSMQFLIVQNLKEIFNEKLKEPTSLFKGDFNFDNQIENLNLEINNLKNYIQLFEDNFTHISENFDRFINKEEFVKELTTKCDKSEIIELMEHSSKIDEK